MSTEIERVAALCERIPDATGVMFELSDVRAVLARLAEVEAERDAAVARADRHHIELRDKRSDLLNIRGILSPNGGERVVPADVPMVPNAAPAVEWLVTELAAARRMLAAARAELEAARPVVEAAAAYREVRFTSAAGAAGDLLVAAVDLYRSATSDHPSTTEEKP